jgi:spermidine/putrescine transport system substrate-binding protein
LLILTMIASLATTAVAKEKVLRVINWKDYGSDVPWATKAFEQKYGVKVVHDYMASEEELLTKLRTGGVGKYDVALPNIAYVPIAINENLLEPIRTEKLTNYKQLFSKFREMKELRKGNTVYAVPWVWGSTSLAYNSEVIKEDITSLSALWEPKYKGKITFHDDFTDAIMTAALVLGQDPNNPSDLGAIKKKLLEQKPLLKTYWSQGDDWSKLFVAKQIIIGNAWSGQSAAMRNGGQPLKYVIPKEGAIGWVDSWVVVKNAPNRDLADKYIDYMISAGFLTRWAKEGSPAPASEAVLKTLPKKVIGDLMLDQATIDKLSYISYRPAEVLRKWDELWQEVKATP